MIFVRDKGRMCNNILQYGHLYAWGREHGCSTMSMRFAYKYQYFHICTTKYHNIFVYLFAKYGSKLGIIPIVSFHTKDECTRNQEIEMKRHKLIIAEGWYARFPELFIKYLEEIKSLFAFLPSVEKSVENKLSPYQSTLKLGVHIRRGDYATWCGGKFLFSDDQYISVIRQFIKLHSDKDIEIFICGNDPKLNKDVFYDSFGRDNIHFPEGNSGKDLCLLSHCDYLIGAPSTFTLVASMYNDLPVYWIDDASALLTESSFKHFCYLLQHIL